ncbi:hypothetical protein [Mesoplasma melaleucae]|nr:hypothetical protein [Mesoplasma melaleucae]
MANIYGINKPLLVPEKITAHKVLNQVYKDRVYIVNVTVNSDETI